MRLNLYLLLIAIGFGSFAFGQDQSTDEDYTPPPDDPSVFRYYPYYDNTQKLWGYSDVNGKILIKPAFKQVGGFYKGSALVKSTSGWGVINEKVQFLIPAKYDTITPTYGDAYELVNAGDTTWKQIENGILNDVTLGLQLELQYGAEVADAPSPEIESEDNPRQLYINDIVSRLKLIYDEVWGYEESSYHPTCFARKNGKIAVVEIDEDQNTAYQTLPIFDEVKDWIFPVVRKGRSWSIVKEFGDKQEVDTAGIVRPTYKLEPLIADADDIVQADRYIDFDLYYYINNGLYGILLKPENSPWKAIPTQFTSISTIDPWFRTYEFESVKTYLHRVTMPDGRTGLVNAKGVLLFK